jgi:hypothetical protein
VDDRDEVKSANPIQCAAQLAKRASFARSPGAIVPHPRQIARILGSAIGASNLPHQASLRIPYLELRFRGPWVCGSRFEERQIGKRYKGADFEAATCFHDLKVPSYVKQVLNIGWQKFQTLQLSV